VCFVSFAQEAKLFDHFYFRTLFPLSDSDPLDPIPPARL